MASPVLQFKRGALTNLPGLRAGEPALTTDSFDFYVGIDSTTANNKFFGSHRYWKKESNSTGSGINLVESTSSGSDFITLASPATLAGIVTYYFPGTQGNASTVLTNDGNGNLSWGSGSANPVFSGVSTFTDTTDNTLGDPDTGAVQIDGGLGINKNTTIGQSLYVSQDAYVAGLSTFNSYATFNNLATFNSTATFYDVITPSSGTGANAGIQWGSDLWGGSGDVAYVKYYSESGENTRLEIANQNDPDDDIYLNTYQVNISDNLTVLGSDDNILGATNSGAVQIAGGAAIEKNLTVGDGLYVGGNVTVAGVSTFVGSVTFQGGTINLGDSNTDDIVVAGEFKSNLVPTDDATYDLGIGGKRWRYGNFAGVGTFGSVESSGGGTFGSLQVNGSGHVTGNLSVGGTITSINSVDLLVTNKDIVLGITTTGSPTDDTANHGGIAIASNEGTPLVSLKAAGINTLPDTYKQMMWVKGGTFGVGTTDAFLFNYGVGIGSTQVPNGVRLAVGQVQVTEDTVTATTFSGTATKVNTVTAGNANATHYLTFVDSHNGSASSENVYTDDGIYYNPGTNTFTTQYGYFTGDVTVDGTITGTATTATRATTVDTTSTSSNADYFVTFVDTYAGQNGETLRVGAGLSVNPSNGSVKTSGTLSVGNPAALTSYIKAGGGSNALYMYANGDVSFQSKAIVNEIRSSSNPNTLITLSDLDATFARDVGISSNLTVSGDLVVLGNQTIVNTQTLRVQDSLIEVGMVNSGGNLVPPSSDANIDVGVLFHYYNGSAKKASVFWDDSNLRIAVASDVSEASSILTANAYAALEIGSLWVNDCAGQSQVISCTSGERFLNNITVDGGVF